MIMKMTKKQQSKTTIIKGLINLLEEVLDKKELIKQDEYRDAIEIFSKPTE